MSVKISEIANNLNCQLTIKVSEIASDLDD